MALKGLTAKDREDWEKTYSSQIRGMTPQEKENAWINWNVKKKFGESAYNTIGKNAKEREAYWNSHSDQQLSDSIKAFTQKAKAEKAQSSIQKRIQPIKADSDATLVKSPSLDVAKAYTPNKMKEFKEQSDAYHQARMHYDQEYNRAYRLGQEAKRDIKDVADKVSPYYKKYKNTEYLPFSDDDWLEIAKEFNSRRDSYGEDSALLYLQQKMQDTVSKNQSIAEKTWNGFLGMGATAYATILDATAGIAKGTYDFWSGNHKDIPGIDTFGVKQVANWLDAVIDNDVTRYTSDVIKYGSYLPSDIEQAKNVGVGNHPVVQTYAQETGSTDLVDMLFNENTIPNALSQMGFTVGMAGAGKGLGALSKWGFRSLKGAKLARKMAETGKTAMQVRDALGRIQKAENIVNRYGIPAAVGTLEGFVNGLETKQQFMEEGQKEVAEFQQKYVDQEFNKLISEKYDERLKQLTNEYMNNQSFVKGPDGRMKKQMPDANALQKQVLDELYEEAWAKYEEKYGDAEDQLEHNAAIAGMTNFLANSFINGVMNQTLKATLFSPSTTGAIRQSRLGKYFKPKGRYRVKGEGANTTVEGKYGLWDQFKAMTKEPAGELTEEYSQNISDEFSRGGANNNLQHFLENKYNGDGTSKVGELWLSDVGAAFKAAGIASVSKEALRDGFYGMLGSAMGTPALGRRTTAVDSKGNVIKDAKGNIKKTLFGKGLNSAGEVESNLERVARLMPWRSGVFQAWNENKAMKKDVEETAKALQEWIRKPENRAKYDGSVGTFNWAEELQTSADANDVFGYKNSALGKAINDAIMLGKLKGTEFYNSYMNQVFEAANLEEGSDEANQAIDIMRNNIATKESVEGMSDKDILDKIKSNANSILDMQSNIDRISRNLEKQFGELDDDTKESLIYGELQIKDWEDRHDALDEEIHLAFYDAKVDDSVEKSSLSDEQKALIGEYSSIEKATKARDDIREKIKEVQASIDKISEREKNGEKLTDQQKDILRRQKNALEFLKEREKKFSTLNGITKDTNTVLSESEIMDLDPIARAIMLNPKNINNYSEAQQKVINRIIAKAEKPGSDFITKVLDDGKISEAVSRFLREYKAVVADPESFNIYSRLAKRAAAKRAYKERYEAIKDMSDYTQYAQALDQLFVNASNAERNTILEQLQKESDENAALGVQDNFNKYINDRQKVAEVLKRGSVINELKNLSSDDIGLFTRAIAYLTEKGIDLSDINAVTNALGAEDVNGNLFQQYVDALNKDVEAEDMVNFTSVGEVISTVNDVLEQYNKEQKESTTLHAPINLNAPKVQKPTTQPQPSEGQQSSSGPGVFATASTTLAGAEASLRKEKEGEEGGTQGTPQGENKMEPAETPKTNIQIEFENNSTPEVAAQATALENAISNEQNEAVKNRALKVLNKESSKKFNTVEELAADLNAEANKIDIEGESEESKQVAELLRNASSTMMARYNVARARTARAAKAKEEKEQQELSDLAQRSAAYAGYTGAPIATSTVAASIDTLDFNYLLDNFSSNPQDENYSPLLAFLEKYEAKQFLDTHDLDRATTKVYFLADYDVQKEQRKAYEDKNLDYTKDNYPLFIAVESEDGPITVDVVEDGVARKVKVQPIGAMPKTGANGRNGSARLNLIRDRIKDDGEGQEAIADSSGNTIVSKLSDNVSKKAPKQTDIGDNNSIQDLQLKILNVRERAEMGAAPNKAARRMTNAYKKMRSTFLDRLKIKDKVSSKKKSYQGLTYSMPDGKGGSTDVDVWVREIHQTTDRNSSSSIVDLLANNELSALESNSRITGYLYELNKILGSINDNELVLDPGGEISDQLRQEAQKLQDALNNKYGLNNYIRIRGHNYVVKPTNRQTSDGKFVFEVYMTPTKEGEEIFLGEVHAGELSQAEQLNFLRNLILDGNNVRMQDEFHAVAQWNVNIYNLNAYNKQNEDLTEEEKASIRPAVKDLIDVYDDDILEISKEAIVYPSRTVHVEAPYTLEGELKKFDYSPESVPKKPSVTANGDNATETAPLNAPAGPSTQTSTSNGSTVEVNNGTIVQGTAPETQSPAEKVAAKIAEKMQSDAEGYELSPDESSYIEKITKRVRARVTSLIGAIDERLKHTESAWDLPSSNIGTGLDELTRDFFNDRFKFDEAEGVWKVDGKLLSDVYPNGRSKDLSAFVESLNAFKQGLISQGITIVPRNVVAAGTLEVTDSKGVKHSIDVAGTVDLIGYDKEGNWHLYDMKTMRSDRRQNPEYRKKWALQLSLYKKFLENQYGINITTQEIIPILVSYPSPKGAGGNVTYTLSDEEKPDGYNGRDNNQLLKDGRKFFMTSAPTLLERVKDLDYIDVSELPLEGLSDVERAIVQLMTDQHPSVDPEKPGVQMPEGGVQKIGIESSENSEPKLDPSTGLAGGSISGLFKRRKKKSSGSSKSSDPSHPLNQYVESSQRWGVFEGRGLNIEATLNALEAIGITEEKWNMMSPESREHELNCKGVKA